MQAQIDQMNRLIKRKEEKKHEEQKKRMDGK